MVDTSTVLDRAISALKRSQRFRAVEVGRTEELQLNNKQRLDTHQFVQPHTLQTLRKTTATATSATATNLNSTSLSKQNAAATRSRKMPPVTKLTKRQPSPTPPAKRQDSSTSASANFTLSTASNHSPSPSPQPPPKGQGQGPEGDMSTMSQISTYKSTTAATIDNEQNMSFDEHSSQNLQQAKTKEVTTVYRREVKQLETDVSRCRGYLTPSESRSIDDLGGQSMRKSSREGRPSAAQVQSSVASDGSSSKTGPKLIQTLYDSSAKQSSRDHKANSMTQSVVSYSDTFEAPSLSSVSPSTKSTKSQQGSTSPTNQSRQSTRNEGSSKSAKPKRQTGQEVFTYSFSYATEPSSKTKSTPPVATAEAGGPKLVQISPELGQELSIIVDNLQSLCTTVTTEAPEEDRTAALIPHSTRPVSKGSPEMTYTQDFLSEREEEAIQELRHISQFQQPPHQTIESKSNVSGSGTGRKGSGSGNVVAFPPGIEPRKDVINFVLQPVTAATATTTTTVATPVPSRQSRGALYTNLVREVIESNERMYEATLAAAKKMGKVYRDQRQELKAAKAVDNRTSRQVRGNGKETS